MTGFTMRIPIQIRVFTTHQKQIKTTRHEEGQPEVWVPDQIEIIDEIGVPVGTIQALEAYIYRCHTRRMCDEAWNHQD